ncbi:MAG: ABC transporter ATP-binding protein [Anaerolineae bacterium]|nr:ABC transporter ATP-binding protein [Anaerolineae bacterium]
MSIELIHVSKSFDTNPIVRDVSVSIATGELFVLLGASGSGKSTLLRLIAGLLELDGGTILLNDIDVTRLSPQQRGTGFVFQNYSLFRHMTVAQNIEFGLSIRKVKRPEREQKVSELLELIELQGYEDRFPGQLSGGQQQRVALARALAYEPNVLLLDEPFGALDVKIRVQLRQNLRAIQQRLGLTAILVTHDQEEAFDIADRIGIIDQGELLEVGAPDQLYRNPTHRFTATFLGTANLLDAHRNGTNIYLGGVKIPAPANTEQFSGKPVEVLARPEEVALSRTQEQSPGSIIGKGIVESVVFAGPALRVTLHLQGEGGKTLQALLTPSDVRDLDLAVGQEVWISLKEYHLLASSVK